MVEDFRFLNTGVTILNAMKIPQTLEALTIIWLCLLVVVNAARILAIFPLASRSHFIFNLAVIRSLHDAGHKITFVSPFDHLITMPNVTAVDSKRNTVLQISNFSMFEEENASMIDQVDFWIQKGVEYCHDVMTLKPIQEILRSNEKLYDVMFVQVLALYECYLPLAEKLGIPVIGTAASRVWRLADLAVGNPFNAATLRAEHSDFFASMAFFERLRNALVFVQTDVLNRILVWSRNDEIYQRHYAASYSTGKKDVSLIFVNSHATIVPRPSVPNAIEVAGVHLKSSQPLAENFQKFMDEAADGVIVFSLGSVTRGSSMPAEMRDAFNEAFAQIRQKVIWKYEDEMSSRPANVWPLKWLPQRDLLAHKNVKALIGHCGMSGTYEAIYEAVPMILMPLFADQKSNAAILSELGVGVFLDPLTVTVDKILDALNAVINDTRYADNMRSLSQKYKDRPITAQKSIVYWTEYVIRHGGAAHLKTSAVDIPFYQYFLLDVLVCISVASIVGIYAAVRIFNIFHRFNCKVFNKMVNSANKTEKPE